MAIRTGYAYPLNTAAADFRQWINEVNNAILAMGWVASGDTGQVNFATVAAPVGVSNYPGYAIYTMNDALQASYPYYLKISFGSSSSGQTIPSMIVTLSTGTNGAGTPTGNISTPYTFNGGTSSATTGACYTSGTTSRLTMCFWAFGPAAGAAFTMNIERDLDSSGVNQNVGAGIRFASNASSNHFQQFVPNAGAGAVPTLETKWLGFGNQVGPMVGQNLSTVTSLRQAWGPLRNPEMGMMIAYGSWGPGAPVTMTRYGNSKLYISMYSSGYLIFNTSLMPCAIQPSLLFLWE